MPKLNTAKSIAEAYLDEISDTIEIRQSYNNIVVGMSQYLFGALEHDKVSKSKLIEAQKYKAVDPGAFYKPLVVQVNGVFEGYIRSLTKAVVEHRYETANIYIDLEEDFRKNYVTYAARILTYIKSGSIKGNPYNFDDLLENIGKSLSGEKGYRLNYEVYTKLMGNCTPTRLEDLFSALMLPEPFSDKLGENAQLKAYFKDKTKGRVSIRARECLEEQINLRNDIVHGDLTRSVELTQLKEALEFFRALICALDQLVRT